MAEECCVPAGNIMILACSGGSNVGQLANQAAVELTQEGWGKFFCLAGIGARLSGFVKSAQDVPDLVVIDGCEIGCAKGVLEQAEVPLKGYLVITEMGIQKNKNFQLIREEVDLVKQAVKRRFGVAASGPYCPLPEPGPLHPGRHRPAGLSGGEVSTSRIEVTTCACTKK